jgi:hypothetical protein
MALDAMKKCRVAIGLVFAVLVMGCARQPDVLLNLRVSSADRAVVEEVRRILMFRFGEFRPSFLSSIEATIDGPTLSFRFKGGAPASSIVTYLYKTPGRLRTTLVGNPGVLFTDQDIEQAALAYENERHVVRLRLTPAAGNRVLALTTRNVGNTARLTLDGRLLLEAVITGALRDSFQITSPEQDTEKAMALVVVLQSGALPAVVSPGDHTQGI